jgi:hypothetical protein
MKFHENLLENLNFVELEQKYPALYMTSNGHRVKLNHIVGIAEEV